MRLLLHIKRLGASRFVTVEPGGLVCLHAVEDGRLLGSIKPPLGAQAVALCTDYILAFNPDRCLTCIRLAGDELSIDWQGKFYPISTYGFKGSIPVVQTKCTLHTYNENEVRFTKEKMLDGRILAYHADYLIVEGYKYLRVLNWDRKELFTIPRKEYGIPFECTIENGFLTLLISTGPVQIFRMSDGELVYERYRNGYRFYVRAYFDTEAFLLYLYEEDGFSGPNCAFLIIDIRTNKEVHHLKAQFEIQSYEFVDKGRKFVTRSRDMLDVLSGTITKY